MKYKTKIRSKRESTVQKTQPPHLKMGTNKGMGQETHSKTNRARIHRQEVNVIEHRLKYMDGTG